MSDTEEEKCVDLSHYDLKDEFSAYDAACLIAGIDPYAQSDDELRGGQSWGRVRAIWDAIDAACERVSVAFIDEAHAPQYRSGAQTIVAPWGETDPDGEWIPMLPSVQQEAAFIAYMRTLLTSYLTREFEARHQSFRRADIAEWLKGRNFKNAYYFWTPSNGAPQSAEIDRLNAELSRAVVIRRECEAEIFSLESELARAKNSHPSSEAPFSIERDKLLKQIGALALLLSEKSSRYKSGDKPNGSQIAAGVGELVDAMPDANARGLGDSSIRSSISEGLKLLAV